MFYSDLTNRCSTYSHWYSARILIRGGVLTHCFRLFVPTAGAGGTLRFVQCMPNGGQSCTVQRPLCVKGAVSFRGPGEAQRQRVRWGEEEQRSDCAFRPQGGNKGCGACDDEGPLACLSPLSFFTRRKMVPPEGVSGQTPYKKNLKVEELSVTISAVRYCLK